MLYLLATVGCIITLPLIALEAIGKIVIFIISLPFAVIAAILYPLVKNKINVFIFDKIWRYCIKFKNGFYTSRLIHKYLN